MSLGTFDSLHYIFQDNFVLFPLVVIKNELIFLFEKCKTRFLKLGLGLQFLSNNLLVCVRPFVESFEFASELTFLGSSISLFSFGFVIEAMALSWSFNLTFFGSHITSDHTCTLIYEVP